MASWNIPALMNAIKNDILGLGWLLRSLAIGDPSAGNTDLPAQAKRMQEGADGWEWQMFNGEAWNRLTKWNLNAAQVDGFDASTGTTANTIPVRDKNGKLPGDILGNAATATKAAELSAVNPVTMGGTGGSSADQARENLGVAQKKHDSASTEFGLGSGTKYGHNKLSDDTDSELGADSGTAATPKAVKTAKAEAVTAASEALTAFAEEQASKEKAQDSAISTAQESASAAGQAAAKAQTSADAAAQAAEEANNAALLEAVPPGIILDFAGNGTPVGRWLPAWTGAEVSRTTYAELFAAIGTTWGEGDGSTTFNLPNQADRVRQGSATAGTQIEAGLPGLNGKLTNVSGQRSGAISGSGVFSATQAGNWVKAGTETNVPYSTITFAAAGSSAVYGASNTVQMAAITTRPFIKY